MNGHIRHGIGAVRPYLYGNAAVAQFIAEVFKAEELERLETRGGCWRPRGLTALAAPGGKS